MGSKEETCPGPPPSCSSSNSIYRDPNAAVECRVKDLISRMTLKEKVAQMTQIEKSVADLSAITQLSIGMDIMVFFIFFNYFFLLYYLFLYRGSGRVWMMHD